MTQLHFYCHWEFHEDLMNLSIAQKILYCKNVLHTKKKNGYFKNCSVKGSLGKLKWFSDGFDEKTPSWKLKVLYAHANHRKAL